MVRTKKNLTLKDFLLSITNVKDYTPADSARVKQEYEEREKHRARLDTLLANHSDREALALALEDRITEAREGAYCVGVRHGYKLAEGLAKLEKGKPKHKAIAKIARVLMKNPKATNKQICLALDKDKIEVYKSKSMPKDALFWSQVAKIPYYKTLFSRVRKQVARVTLLSHWQNMMDIIDADEAHGSDFFGDL